MKYEQELRDILTASTIRLIAAGGFERATTKAITQTESTLPIKINEVYIYRLFGSKENLYASSFLVLDNELVHALRRCIDSHRDLQDDPRKMLYEIFWDVWRFILGNESHCRCYIRYYYSVYFKGETQATHNRLFDSIIAEFASLFKEEADVKSIMHSVFTTILDFAIRVYNGDLENSDLNVNHIFNVVYCMMVTYFKDEPSVEVHMSQFI